MRANRSWLVLLVLPLLVSSVLVAQGIPTGTILGRVINEGQGLPGTTVVAKSPALQGSRTAVTSANGDFTFVNLPAASTRSPSRCPASRRSRGR